MKTKRIFSLMLASALLLCAFLPQVSAGAADASVTGIVLDGSTATVTYQLTLGTATLFVGVYDDSGCMTACGTAAVTQGTDTVSVTVSGVIPDSCVLRAFVTDSSDTPIGERFVTREYSKRFGGLSSAKEGDYITFGSYEQDNVATNGKEDIEWLVLKVDTENHRMLVISRYALDCKQFHYQYTGVTWETCSLRNWYVNSAILNDAFTPEERAMILTTTVTADANPYYPNFSAGNNTQDKLFLLSMVEAQTYFSSDEDRLCTPTAYAKAQGASAGTACGWWLRSPGSSTNGDYAAYVDNSGKVNQYGMHVSAVNFGIRPAMWIDLAA